MKRKDLFWMLVPCLLLIGVGTYFSRRPAKEFQIVIDEAKLMPATPLEVFKGYDMRLVVKTHLINLPRGEEPSPNLNYRQYSDLEISYVKNGKETALPLLGYADCLAARREDLMWNRTFGLKLAKVPVSLGRLNLRLTASGDQLNYSLHRVVRKTPKVSLSLPLRQVGQRIVRPQPNKIRPFKLKNITSQWLIYAKGGKWLVTVHLTLLDDSITNESLSEKILDNIVLDTNKGKIPQWKFYQGSDSQMNGKSAEINFYVDTTMFFPPNISNATFKADLSINDCWPQPFSIVLRKDGKNITRDEPAL